MVYFLFTVGFFFLGTCIGSFFGTLMETTVKRSFWTGRSQCLTCSHTLQWFELIPVISYLIQGGRCRQCGIRIPSWVLSIEVMTGIVWMFFGTLFAIHGYNFWIIGSHLLLLSMLLILAIEDIRSFTIPDRLSLPMIGITLVIIITTSYKLGTGFLPHWQYAIIGGIIGMCFYLVQMIIPGVGYLLQKKKYHTIISLFLLPFFFPFWLIAKILFGEKKADMLIPSVGLIDNLPTWVGGGDVRLGILLGFMTGPLYFWWVIGIGYTLGTLFWLISQLGKKQKIDILPVAPLLFLGFCVTWLIRFFS